VQGRKSTLAEQAARAGMAVAGRGLDAFLSDLDLFKRWLKHAHPTNKPLTPDEANKVWKKLMEIGRSPAHHQGHPGTQWHMPHINVDGNHIPVAPGWTPPSATP